jgi:uncharacterized membrane protein YciS (DUF1049 family)
MKRVLRALLTTFAVLYPFPIILFLFNKLESLIVQETPHSEALSFMQLLAEHSSLQGALAVLFAIGFCTALLLRNLMAWLRDFFKPGEVVA